MEYITAEQFLKQPLEVQRDFREYFDREKMLYTFNDFIYYGIFKDELEFIPNPVEGQIRQFIEDKTNSIIDSSYSRIGGYDFQLYEKGNYGYLTEQFLCLEHNMLQAYWKVACQIASKEVKQC